MDLLFKLLYVLFEIERWFRAGIPNLSNHSNPELSLPFYYLLINLLIPISVFWNEHFYQIIYNRSTFCILNNDPYNVTVYYVKYVTKKIMVIYIYYTTVTMNYDPQWYFWSNQRTFSKVFTMKNGYKLCQKIWYYLHNHITFIWRTIFNEIIRFVS